MLENHAYEEFRKIMDDLSADLFPQRRKKVMVIDDDLDFRLSVCELLVDEGFSVTTAKDGEAGLNHLIHQKDRPDLIIVDLMMPIKTGLEFRREQLKMTELNQIPVIFITGQGYVEGETCLLKPFDDRDFIETVKKHVGR